MAVQHGDRVVRVGAPSVRNVVRTVGEPVILATTVIAVSIALKPSWALLWMGSWGLITLAVLVFNLWTEQVIVSPDAAEVRTWLQVALRRPGKTWTFLPGRRYIYRAVDARGTTTGRGTYCACPAGTWPP